MSKKIELTYTAHVHTPSAREDDVGPESLRAAIVELVKAARAWDEFDGGHESTAWLDIQERLSNAYRAFTEPYADDEFAEDGVIVSEPASAAVFLLSASPGGDHPGSGEGSCLD